MDTTYFIFNTTHIHSNQLQVNISIFKQVRTEDRRKTEEHKSWRFFNFVGGFLNSTITALWSNLSIYFGRCKTKFYCMFFHFYLQFQPELTIRESIEIVNKVKKHAVTFYLTTSQIYGWVWSKSSNKKPLWNGIRSLHPISFPTCYLFSSCY